MKATLDDFKTGWYGLLLEMTTQEIDKMIEALQGLKESRDHFHCRSDFKGTPGIGDIEVAWSETAEPGGLTIEAAPPIYPDDGGA